jgi:hypothetical protein
MTREKLLDPTGSDRKTGGSDLAQRPASLRGLTVGLLGNTKPNAEVLLAEIADELKGRYDVGEFRSYTKDYFGTPVKTELFDQIVAECDVVVTAVGDCGSCSAATVADGIAFERAGIPAVAIISDSFLLSGNAMARMQGFGGFEFIAVHHPVASLGEAELHGRVQAVLPDVLRILGAEPAGVRA